MQKVHLDQERQGIQSKKLQEPRPTLQQNEKSKVSSMIQIRQRPPTRMQLPVSN